jgi:phosphoglycolate phosphatase
VAVPPYALAIFDFDGTLADSWPLMGDAIAEAADRFGFRRPSAEDVQRLRGQDNRAAMRALGVTTWHVPRLVMHMRRVAAQHADRIELFAGVQAMLWRLQAAGVRVAVVSSNTEATIRQVLGPDLASVVERYDCGAALFGKASRFRRVVRGAGVPRAQVIAIGDEGRDIEAATTAGIASGAVTWGYATADLLARCGPTHVFTTVESMAEALTSAEPLRAPECAPSG